MFYTQVLWIITLQGADFLFYCKSCQELRIIFFLQHQASIQQKEEVNSQQFNPEMDETETH